MIANPDGKIYIMYYQPASKFVRMGEHEYVATVQHGVSMFLVDPADAQNILDFRGGGCCGQPAHPFSLPSQEAINVWETGNR